MNTTATFDPALYVVVPREPTHEMTKAFAKQAGGRLTGFAIKDGLRDAIAAAPPLPEQPPSYDEATIRAREQPQGAPAQATAATSAADAAHAGKMPQKVAPVEPPSADEERMVKAFIEYIGGIVTDAYENEQSYFDFIAGWRSANESCNRCCRICGGVVSFDGTAPDAEFTTQGRGKR